MSNEPLSFLPKKKRYVFSAGKQGVVPTWERIADLRCSGSVAPDTELPLGVVGEKLDYPRQAR